MDLASKVAELDKASAVFSNELKNHLDRDNERFDTIVRGMTDMNSKMDLLVNRVEKGVTRAHDRIDAEVTARNSKISALQKSQLMTKIWALTAAVGVTGAMAWYFFTDRMDDVKRATTTPAALVSGAQAGEITQQN